MPLNRDQSQDDGRPPLDAEKFTSQRQQTRSQPEKNSGQSMRPDSPQDETRVLFHGRKGSTDKQTDVVKTGKQFSLFSDDESISNDMKLPIITTLPPKQDKSSVQKFAVPGARQPRTVVSQKVHYAQPIEKATVFDTTGSFDISYDDGDYEATQDIIQRPQSRTMQGGRDSPRYAVHGNEGRSKGFSIVQGLGRSDPNYNDIVNIGRELINSRGPADAEKIEQKIPNKQNEMDRRSSFGSDSMLPDTPSRSRSAPIQDDIVAPVARKHVAIHSSPQFMNPSPMLGSEEIAREDSPDMPQSRPRSAFSGTRGATLPQRTQQWQPRPQSQLRETQTVTSGRFQTAGSHNHSVHMRGQKVSAPESDVPESSEDERPAHLEEKPAHPPPSSYIDKKLSHGRKRSHDETDLLDHDQADLAHKTLADLQNEPFIKDPRIDSEPHVDQMGNALNLSTVFEKWSKLSDEVVKGIFQIQTDDEWSQTGQWFVDSFQADLKELMEVRLARRKIALDFEYRIRQRQREVQHYRAGLGNELRELHEGGSGLLRDRKMTAGSRSNTPVKPSRSH